MIIAGILIFLMIFFLIRINLKNEREWSDDNNSGGIWFLILLLSALIIVDALQHAKL